MEWSFLCIHIYQGYVKILLFKKKKKKDPKMVYWVRGCSVKWFSFKSTDRILEKGLWFYGKWPLLTSREGIFCDKGVCRERNSSQKVMNSVCLNHAFSSIPATSTYCFATLFWGWESCLHWWQLRHLEKCDSKDLFFRLWEENLE